MKVYTKTGDKGTTSLVGGARIDKSHARIEAYGTIDELNSALGYLLALLPEGSHVSLLESVQHALFNVGCHLATDIEPGNETDAPCLDPPCAVQLETAIDQMQAKLPPQTHFILPGGTPAAAWAHVCRTICRRAERRVVALSHEAHVSFSALQYLNRLSDYLFVLARFINHNADLSEKTWQNTCK